MLRSIAILLLTILLWGSPAQAEDGYDLWLRYRPLDASFQQGYQSRLRNLVVEGDGPTMTAARTEMQRGLSGLLGRGIPISRQVTDGSVLIGTPALSVEIAALKLPLKGLGRDGFVIRTAQLNGKRILVIAGNEDLGVLYGAFALLRRIQSLQTIEKLDVRASPRLTLRMLDHWDNLDRTVERGYAGFSIWDWHKLPAWKDSRYVDYARANASIGINGAALTNVNASAEVLTPQYIEKVAALADIFRPWGIRVFLTARFQCSDRDWRTQDGGPVGSHCGELVATEDR